MSDGLNDELIASAAAVLNPRTVGDRLFGDVGSTLVTAAGRRYSGVCVDTSGSGFCAEQAAIAAMVTAGEYRIARIVAVWRDADGTLYVLPPCGHCREFIRQVDPANIETEVSSAAIPFAGSGNCCPSVSGRRRLTHQSGKKAEVPGLSGHTGSV